MREWGGGGVWGGGGKLFCAAPEVGALALEAGRRGVKLVEFFLVLSLLSLSLSLSLSLLGAGGATSPEVRAPKLPSTSP